MNTAAVMTPSTAVEFSRPSVAFPRYTLRDLLIEIFYHKWIMALAFVVPVALALVAASMTKPSYVANARLLVLYGSEYFYRPVTGQSSNSSIPLDRNEIMLGELQVLQSQTLAIQTLKAVGVDRVYPGTAPDDPAGLAQAALRFEKDFTSSSIAQSNVLELGFRSYNPDVAADVLRTMIDGYLQRRVAIFAHPPSPTVQADQDSFRDRLAMAEAAIAQFTIAHGIGNFEEQMTLLLQTQSSNTAARADTAQTASEVAAKLAVVQQQIPRIPATIQLYSDTDRSQRAQLLTENMTQLQIKRRDLATRYQPNAPAMVDLDRQIAAVTAQMQQGAAREGGVVHAGRNPVLQDLQGQELSLQGQRQGLKARQVELDATAASIAARLRELNQSAQEYRDLLRNRDVLDQTYRALVRSNEDTQIADAAERNRAANIRVVQPPERPPAGRNLATAVVAGGFVIGLIAALAALAVSNALKQVFVSARDISVVLELPVLVGIARGQGGARKRGRKVDPSSEWERQTIEGTLGA